MAAAPTLINFPSVDGGTQDHIHKTFTAEEKITKTLRQVQNERKQANASFLNDLLPGNFDAAQVLNAFNTLIQKEEVFTQQEKALNKAKETVLDRQTSLKQDPTSRAALIAVLKELRAELEDSVGRKQRFEALLAEVDPSYQRIKRHQVGILAAAAALGGGALARIISRSLAAKASARQQPPKAPPAPGDAP